MDKADESIQSVGEKKPAYKGWIIRILIIGTVAGCAHSWYVSHLFENDRHFSHLSEMEREMSLRSEMGFYFSYYKTVVEEKPFLAGISKLMVDRLVEYPKEVNAFNRFNIHPEVLLGSVYRCAAAWLPRRCRTVERPPAAPVQSCVGAGEPVYFYLGGVWLAAGCTVAALFGYGCVMSGSLLGGALALLHYLANHAEATRVMWAPNSRENFAQPLLLAQMALLTAHTRPMPPRAARAVQVGISVLNCLCLLFWQFSQFVFLTQTAIYFLMEQLRIISWQSLCMFLHSHFCGLHMAILLLQGNDMLKSSLYASLFLVVSVYAFCLSTFRLKVRNRTALLYESCLVVLRLTVAAVAAVWVKEAISDTLNVEEDRHVWEILYSKFGNFKNFHTRLYTCSDVFAFLPLSSWWNLTASSLLPLASLAICLTLRAWNAKAMTMLSLIVSDPQLADSSDEDSGIDNADAKTRANNAADDAHKMADSAGEKADTKMAGVEIDRLVTYLGALRINAGVFYNLCQMAVFGVMAALVMRLKLLFVPHLCIVAASLADVKMIGVSESTERKLKTVGLPALVAYLAYRCYLSVAEETSHYGEFSDPDLEELLQWIIASTPPSAAFAAPMPLAAAVLLSARRPVANHPHYEHRDSRERNYAVYKAYGRFAPKTHYEDLARLRVSYVVVERAHCRRRQSGGNCTFAAIWDDEAPELRHRPLLCEQLQRDPHLEHFYPVFRSRRYVVLRVHDLSIRYTPRALDT